jgi:hypothetical protein
MKAVTCCVGAILGVVCGVSQVARAQDDKPDPSAVSDRDRVFLNYVRDAATVGAGNLRLEIRGFRSEDTDNPEMDITGFPLEGVRRNAEGKVVFQQTETVDSDPEIPPNPERQIDTTQMVQQATLLGTNGGFISILGSYGLGQNAEIGFDIPILFRKVRLERTKNQVVATTTFSADPDTEPTKTQTKQTLTDVVGQNNTDIGDITLYVKFKHQVAENCRIGGGVEITPPTGPERKFFGTGELGVNPFLATRYQRGRIGAQLHVGWFLYTGDVPDVLNYSAAFFVRPTAAYALRVEFSGRHFSDFGRKFDDVLVLPGIDFSVTEYLTVRPVGMFNITDVSQDWGVGAGLALQLPVL